MKINKIKVIGKAKILETEEGKFVLKKTNKKLTDLFNYLESRNYISYPNIIEEEENLIRYEYINEEKTFLPEEHDEYITKVAELHYKTVYYKEVSRKKYKEIYNKLIDNIDYLKDFYNKLIENIENETYMSPSNYLLIRNYSIINSNLYYIEKELNSWYNIVKDKTKERVSVVHNNLKFNNFIKGDKKVLTSWENYLVDTPIIDLYKLYRNEYNNADMASLFKKYTENFELKEEEIKLFNIMISMPIKIDLTKKEYEKTKSIKKMLDYTFRTSNFINLAIFKKTVDEKTN